MEQQERVFDTYGIVRNTFEILGKKWRDHSYWTSSNPYLEDEVWIVVSDTEGAYRLREDKRFMKYVRPVLRLVLQ